MELDQGWVGEYWSHTYRSKTVELLAMCEQAHCHGEGPIHFLLIPASIAQSLKHFGHYAFNCGTTNAAVVVRDDHSYYSYEYYYKVSRITWNERKIRWKRKIIGRKPLTTRSVRPSLRLPKRRWLAIYWRVIYGSTTLDRVAPKTVFLLLYFTNAFRRSDPNRSLVFSVNRLYPVQSCKLYEHSCFWNFNFFFTRVELIWNFPYQK